MNKLLRLKIIIALFVFCCSFIACEKESLNHVDKNLNKTVLCSEYMMWDSIEGNDTNYVYPFFENLLNILQNTNDTNVYLYIIYHGGYYYYSFVTEMDENLPLSNIPWSHKEYNNDEKDKAVEFATKKAKQGYEVKIGRRNSQWVVCYREKEVTTRGLKN